MEDNFVEEINQLENELDLTIADSSEETGIMVSPVSEAVQPSQRMQNTSPSETRILEIMTSTMRRMEDLLHQTTNEQRESIDRVIYKTNLIEGKLSDAASKDWQHESRNVFLAEQITRLEERIEEGRRSQKSSPKLKQLQQQFIDLERFTPLPQAIPPQQAGQNNIIYSLDAYSQPVYESKPAIENIDKVRNQVQEFRLRQRALAVMKEKILLQEESDRKFALELQAQEDAYAEAVRLKNLADKNRIEQQKLARESFVSQPYGSAERHYRNSIDDAVNKNNHMFQSENGAFGDMFQNLNSIRRETMFSVDPDRRASTESISEGIASQLVADKPIQQRDTLDKNRQQTVYDAVNPSPYDPTLGYQYNPSPPVQSQYVQQFNNIQAQQ